MRASCMKKVCRYLPYRPKRASGEASRVFCNGYLPFAFKYRTHLKVKRSTFPRPRPATRKRAGKVVFVGVCIFINLLHT